MEGNTSLKRKEGHEADEAKAQGTLATAAEPPKHKKARTEEENTERGKGAAEQASVGELKEALAKGTAQDVIYWMKVPPSPLFSSSSSATSSMKSWLTSRSCGRTGRSSNSSPPTPSTSPWRYFPLPLLKKKKKKRRRDVRVDLTTPLAWWAGLGCGGQTLVDAKIRAAPIYDPAEQKYVGFVDMLDLTAAIVELLEVNETFKKKKNKKEETKKEEKEEEESDDVKRRKRDYAEDEEDPFAEHLMLESLSVKALSGTLLYVRHNGYFMSDQQSRTARCDWRVTDR